MTVWFKRAIAALAFVLPVSASAQSIYVYPAAATAPRGSYQSVTAVLTGVNDKTVTWSSDGGTIVGTNPCVVNEPCTVALYTTTAGTYHLTATSNANHSVTATSTITITSSPSPVTTHPRLYITASMLPALRAKFATGSPMATAIKNQAISYYNADNAYFGWGTSGACGGSHSPTSPLPGYEERNAYYYALMSLIDPSDSNYNWSCYGHDLWVNIMSSFVAGTLVPNEDEWRQSAPQFSFTTDWLIGSGALSSASDLSLARSFVYAALQWTVSPSHFGPAAWLPPNGYSNDTSLYNSPGEFGGISKLRTMGNNYALARNIYLSALPLTFNDDTTDDPATANTCSASRYVVCPDWTAGSRHAFFNYFAGSILYDDYAHLEDPNVSLSALQAKFGNLPSPPMCRDWQGDAEVGSGTVPCLGDGRGGESSEGSGYGYSVYSLRYGLNAMWTAGYADPMIWGPQVSLATSSWWDMHAVADDLFLSGMEPKNGNTSGTAAAYSFMNTGDTNTYYRYPGWFQAGAGTLVFDSYTGRTDRTGILEWPILNTAFGGPDGTAMGCTDHCGFIPALSTDFGSGIAIDMFLALPAADPVASGPSDPRPSLPTDLYNGSYNQHQIVRNGWTGSNANSFFSYTCGNSLIDHEHGTCGRFEVYSGNEYITKGRTTFDDYNFQMSSVTQSNELSIMNTGSTCGTTSCFYYWSYASGGQWWHGIQGDMVTLLHSELPSYAADISDMTGQYNTYGPGYVDVTAASRSLVYLRGSNQVVFYDRAATGSSNAKAVYLNTTGKPTVANNVASWVTQSGSQRAYLTALLGGTLSDIGLASGNSEQAYDWEVVSTLKNDGGSVAANHFLDILEWGSSGLAKSSTTLVQSTSGQSFDGARVGASLVMFMRSWPATFTSVTYPASGATTHYISDLAPNTRYGITGTGTPASATTDTAGVLVFSAAGTGSITVGTGPALTLQSITVNPSAASLNPLGTQQYSANCAYSDGSNQDCTTSVTWQSSAINVATVNVSGLVTAVAQGDANIIAGLNGIRGQGAASVAAPVLQKILVTPGSTMTPVGATQQFTATGTYSDSSTADITSSVKWASSNTAVTAVNNTGLVTTLAQGNAAIVVTGGSVQAQATVTVVVSTPSFTPASGSYNSAQTVTISSPLPSAVIHYTTNGSTPTGSSPTYTGPITVSTTETIQAIAVAAGYPNSAVASASYTITLSAAATPSFSPAGGTYSTKQSVTITSVTAGSVIHYTTDGSMPTTSSPVYSGPISVSTTQTVNAIAVAAGYSTSSVGSASYTITLSAAATPSFSPAGGTYTTNQSVTIASATAGSVIHYTTDGSAPTANSPVYSGPISVSTTQTVTAIAVAAGYSNSALGSASYTIVAPTAAMPGFSPAGGTYSSSQSVTITTATRSATIYYTTDGSMPTVNSKVYSGSVTVGQSETIQAIAVASGYSNSAVGSAVYNINVAAPVTAAPTFSPAGGTYTSKQSVKISGTTHSATIYYTTDGSVPTVNSKVYSNPITVSSNETINAIAVVSGVSSPESSATYTINANPVGKPKFSLALSKNSLTLAPGGTATTTVFVVPTDTSQTQASLSCSGVPDGLSCSVSPSTVQLSGSTVSSTLIITAASQTATSEEQPGPLRRDPVQYSGVAAALSLCCLNRRKIRQMRIMMAAFAFIGIGLCSGCGSVPPQTQQAAAVSVVAAVGDSATTAQVTVNLQ